MRGRGVAWLASLFAVGVAACESGRSAITTTGAPSGSANASGSAGGGGSADAGPLPIAIASVARPADGCVREKIVQGWTPAAGVGCDVVVVCGAPGLLPSLHAAWPHRSVVVDGHCPTDAGSATKYSFSGVHELSAEDAVHICDVTRLARVAWVWCFTEPY